jgi:hypothetical protein
MRRCDFLSRLPRYIGKKAVLQFIILRTLREPDRRRRYEERLSRSKQRISNQKRPLDRKNSIQERILLPPAGSLPQPVHLTAEGEKPRILGLRVTGT